MLEELKVNNKPSREKFEIYNEDNNTFYRFQNPNHEIGEQSWGMIYSSPEEAIEDGSDVLNGKSCCWTARELSNYMQYFDKDHNVLVVNGRYVEDGHDGEPVVDIISIEEVWSYEDYCKLEIEIEDEELNL